MKIGGKEISNWWLIGGAGGIGLVWYLYKRGSSGSSSSAGSSADNSSAIDPVTGLPYSQDDQVDPATGLTYLAEAEQYGSVAAAEAEAESGAGYTLGDDSYSGTAGYATSDVGGTTSTTGSYSTNAQWAQAVTSGLTGLGYSSTDIAAALGLFFAGQQLGTAPDGVSYVQIVEAAEAEYGPPPQGTYDIIAANPNSTGAGSTGSSGSGGGSTGSGTGSAGSGRLSSPGGFKVAWAKGGSGSCTWDPVTGAKAYVFQLKKGGANGSTVSGPFDVAGTTANFGPGIPAGELTAFVWPSDPTDQGGPSSNQPHAQLTFTMPS